MMSNDVTVCYWTYHVCCFETNCPRLFSPQYRHGPFWRLNLGGRVAFLSVLLLIVFAGTSDAVRINLGCCRRLKFRVLTSHTDTRTHTRTYVSIILVCDHIIGVSVPVGVHLDAKSMYHKCWPAYRLKYSVRRKASTGSLSSVRNELLSSDHWIKLWFKLWTLSRFVILPLTINETLKRLSSLPILMQESFWWWRCSISWVSLRLLGSRSLSRPLFDWKILFAELAGTSYHRIKRRQNRFNWTRGDQTNYVYRFTE